MKKLSLWGFMNPYKTQFIIAMAQITLIAIAFYVGIWLFAQDILLSNTVFYIGLTLFWVSFACYPIRRARYSFWKTTFGKQKTMDAFLLVSYMLMAITVSNREANITWKTATNSVQNVQIVLKTGENAPTRSVRFKDKWMKKYTQFVIKEKQNLKSSGSDFGTALGVTAIVFLMVLLMTVVLGLSCTLACSGSNALALVALIGGWALIITLGIQAIRKVRGTRKNNYQPMPETPKPN